LRHLAKWLAISSSISRTGFHARHELIVLLIEIKRRLKRQGYFTVDVAIVTPACSLAGKGCSFGWHNWPSVQAVVLSLLARRKSQNVTSRSLMRRLAASIRLNLPFNGDWLTAQKQLGERE
jgi:hypothetical protein